MWWDVTGESSEAVCHEREKIRGAGPLDVCKGREAEKEEKEGTLKIHTTHVHSCIILQLYTTCTMSCSVPIQTVIGYSKTPGAVSCSNLSVG